MKKQKIAIFGSGPSALISAYFLGDNFNVTIYEKENNIGQKLLVAGKGGFNLTNSLTGINLTKKYIPENFLKESILNFDSTKLREWLDNIGVPTFVGTSGRVFSIKKLKPIDVLNKIKTSLVKKNVEIFTNQKFIYFNKDFKPIVRYNNKAREVIADFYIFALGGASWSITGSDGKWTKAFREIGIETIPFQPSNCGININWSENIKSFHIGKPLKNIQISCGNNTASGEAVITEYGLEGNVVYSLIPQIRLKLKDDSFCQVKIDLKPNNTEKQLLEKLNDSVVPKNYKKIFNLNNTQIALIKSLTQKDDYINPKKFVQILKSLRVQVNSLRPIEEAISTVGGIAINELNSHFSLKKFPNIFTIGEMVDWDAPTGGFLLQGCFSMGYWAAASIISKKG